MSGNMLTGLQGAALVNTLCLIIYTKTLMQTLAYGQYFLFSLAIETFNIHFRSTTERELYNEFPCFSTQRKVQYNKEVNPVRCGPADKVWAA